MTKIGPRQHFGKIAGMAAVAMITFGSPTARAEWIQSVGVGQKTSNLGGAVTARGKDYDTSYTNPAGAADIRRPTIGGGVKLFDSTNLEFKDSTGNHAVRKTILESDIALIPGVGAYYPLNNKLTVGFGFGAPFAIAGAWNKKAGIHRFNMQDQSLIVTDLSPTIGYKVNNWLSIGGSLNVVAFKHLRLTALFGDNYLGGGADGLPDGQIRLDTDNNFWLPVPPFDNFDPAFDEVSFTLGAQLHPTDRFSFGVVYRHETPTTFEGSVSTNLTGVVLRDKYSAKVHMPGHLQAGIAYDVLPGKLTLSADVRWTMWSKADGLGSSKLNVNFKNGTILGLSGLQIDYQLDDTVSLHLGGNYKIDKHWSLQAGYVYDPSPVKNSRIDILTYSSDRHILSLGGTYDMKADDGSGWELTLGGQAIFYEDRTIQPGQSANLGGLSSAAFPAPGTVGFTPNTDKFTYGGFLWTLGASATYTF